MTALVDWDAAALSAAIWDRVVSCVEVMTAYLDRIDAVNPRVNAVVSLRPRDELLAEARDKDRLLADGIHQGWMHGFPHAVKDLADAAGLHTSLGLLAPGEVPPAATDAIFVQRIRAAGAVVIGKTNVPQLGLGSQTYNDVFGTTGNAFDPARTAGGSSGGAAVAVALRMVPVADGSDFMGSLRNPPGWNGVYGLRPAVGRVPSADEERFVAQAGVEGPIARTPGDLALLLQTMSGPDPRAPLALRDTPSFTDRRPVRGRHVAWLGDLGGYLPMEPEVLAVTRQAVDRLPELGVSVTALDEIPGFATADLWPTWLTYRHWLCGMAVQSLVDLGLQDRLKPEALFELEGLQPLSAVDVFEASVARSALHEAMRRLLQTYDHVLLPTAQVMPFDAGTHWPAEIAGTPMSSYHRWMEVTALATLINAPALAMPAGVGTSGLPIGLQVIGPDEAGLLDLAAAWDAHGGWSRQVPPSRPRGSG